MAKQLEGDYVDSILGGGQKPAGQTTPAVVSEDTDLVKVTVRLPGPVVEKLKGYLWTRRGEKLASGLRRIVMEWSEREGVL